MRVDLYTKAVLTVIAAALVYIAVALTPMGVPVQAQNVERVYIAGWLDNQGYQQDLPLPVIDQRQK